MDTLLKRKNRAIIKFRQDIKKVEKVMGKNCRFVQMAKEKLRFLLDEVKELRKPP